MVDNSKPIIDSDVTVSESPTDPSLVRFLFSIRDEGSGIATVKYTTANPSHVFNKDADVDNSHLYFELAKTELEGLSQLRVSIQATDKVGWTENQTLEIDLTAPTISLEFTDISSLLDDDKLAFTKASQSFTITSTEGEHVKATRYSIDMLPISGEPLKFSGDPLNFNGNIVLSSATGTMDLQLMTKLNTDTN